MNGIAKIVIKTENSNKPSLQIFLKKGEYFGEIALIIDSKRTADVQASDFTICETFNRENYEMLKKEFPDVNKKLRQGLKHYKLKQSARLCSTLQSRLFTNFQQDHVYFYLLKINKKIIKK